MKDRTAPRPSGSYTADVAAPSALPGDAGCALAGGGWRAVAGGGVAVRPVVARAGGRASVSDLPFVWG
jgi:hypothetical protein